MPIWVHICMGKDPDHAEPILVTDHEAVILAVRLAILALIDPPAAAPTRRARKPTAPTVLKAATE